MSLLETKSLSIGYHSKNEHKQLQQDINVVLNKGEIVSLMGQNGVGKTTFIKSIAGLHTPLSGEVFIDRNNLNSLSQSDLSKKISLVLTEKPFSLNMTVVELISIARHPYSNWLGVLNEKDKEVIEWAISETHINYIANDRLYELSDGQLQKVMIARALAQETELIILDEPAAHLDLNNKIEVMLLLRKIASKGKGILISTHDMQVSTQLSDKLWLFNFNKGVLEGSPEDLILDGTLEETLYLKNYGYDMIYGTIEVEQPGPEITVRAPQKEKFWIEVALKRNGFKVVMDAPTSISPGKKSGYQLQTKDNLSSHDTIHQMIESLKKLI